MDMQAPNPTCAILITVSNFQLIFLTFSFSFSHKSCLAYKTNFSPEKQTTMCLEHLLETCEVKHYQAKVRIGAVSSVTYLSSSQLASRGGAFWSQELCWRHKKDLWHSVVVKASWWTRFWEALFCTGITFSGCYQQLPSLHCLLWFLVQRH